MKRSAKTIIDQTAILLNKHVDAGSEFPDETISLVNEIMESIADGARLVVARETDGSLVGFVPKYHVPTAVAQVNPPTTPFGGDPVPE